MTRLVVSGQVGRAFPGLLITAVVTAGFDGHSPWPELDERFGALEARRPADREEGIRSTGGSRGGNTVICEAYADNPDAHRSVVIGRWRVTIQT